MSVLVQTCLFFRHCLHIPKSFLLLNPLTRDSHLHQLFLEVSNEFDTLAFGLIYLEVSTSNPQLMFFHYSNCERLDILVNKEPTVKRHHSKIRLDQLKYDVQQIQTSLNGVLVKQREWERRERERDELLQTRCATFPASHLDFYGFFKVLIPRHCLIFFLKMTKIGRF